ncbi:MAG: hypothetical protein COA54_02440 [Thiotrichaceae bacterium]|nr:MAG: hypothetical protein COA54_02440 [Thiotrichaceae bacterium]
MAVGDLTIFNKGLEKIQNGSWAGADVMFLAICDNTTVPAVAATPVPVLADFTQVGVLGNYISGGISLGALSTLITEAAGVITFDSAVNPEWLADAGNDVDAMWGIIYNNAGVNKECLGFVELGTVDMSVDPLQVIWNSLGLYTIANNG